MLLGGRVDATNHLRCEAVPGLDKGGAIGFGCGLESKGAKTLDVGVGVVNRFFIGHHQFEMRLEPEHGFAIVTAETGHDSDHDDQDSDADNRPKDREQRNEP